MTWLAVLGGIFAVTSALLIADKFGFTPHGKKLEEDLAALRAFRQRQLTEAVDQVDRQLPYGEVVRRDARNALAGAHLVESGKARLPEGIRHAVID